MELNGLHTVLGVELNMLSDNSWSCRSCLVTKNKNAIQIESKTCVNGTLVEVLSNLPKSYPIALSLSGKGVLYKNIQLKDEFTNEQVFQLAFPAVAHKDFYQQRLNQNENHLIQISRMERIDELLSKLKQAGLYLYSLSFGVAPVVYVLPQLNVYDLKVHFDGHLFELDQDQQFVGYQYLPDYKAKFPLKIAEELIPEENLCAFAVAFQLLLHQKLDLIKANVPTIDEAFSAYLSNNRLKKQLVIFTMALFTALLVSFLLLTYYNQNNAKLAEQVGSKVTNADQTQSMKMNIAVNEALLKKLNWNGGYNYGFVLNEIGQSIPKQLQLSEVLMNDFKTENEKIERLPNIKITGVTKSLTAVNNWIYVLKEKDWIKTVKLLKYQDDTEMENYQFNIVINY